MEEIVNNMSVKPDNVNRVLDVLYDIPVINLDELCEKSKIKAGTMRNIILELIDKDILAQEKIFNKSKIITFKKYIDVIEKLEKADKEKILKLLLDVKNDNPNRFAAKVDLIYEKVMY